jgi:superfamily II DNA or RNA helicase
MTDLNASAPGSMDVLFTRGQIGAVGTGSDFSDTTTSNPCEDLFRGRPNDIFAKIKPDIANARPIKLYPDQEQALTRLRAALASSSSHVVLQLPTGGGKTVLAAVLAKMVLSQGKRMIFLVHALSLIDQTFERFVENGIDRYDIGIIQGDHPLRDPDAPIQIATAQTLQRREMPETDLVVIDECHRWFKSYDKWLKNDWRDVRVVGLSATPWTKGLGRYFSQLIIGGTTQSLIDIGRLSDFVSGCLDRRLDGGRLIVETTEAVGGLRFF